MSLSPNVNKQPLAHNKNSGFHLFFALSHSITITLVPSSHCSGWFHFAFLPACLSQCNFYIMSGSYPYHSVACFIFQWYEFSTYISQEVPFNAFCFFHTSNFLVGSSSSFSSNLEFVFHISMTVSSPEQLFYANKPLFLQRS